ncbi:MAG: response regulator transcription factor [Prevotella sp.]|nr:response regulator transcription factor [Prevotella sp.]
MAYVEFRVSPDGQVYYKLGGSQERRLTKFSEGVVSELEEIIKGRFPTAYARLVTLYPRSVFDQVQRFVRCNFGEHDLLTHDIEDGVMNFEEVHCRLRGMCEHEGIICKPRSILSLSPEEKRVADLYKLGYTMKEIAELLGKSPKTVNVQLCSIKNKLKVKNCREIIKVLRLGNY